jgi:hypothetical protein
VIDVGWITSVSIERFAGMKKARTLSEPLGFGGAEGDRTLDLRIANATLSQLSYRPVNK